MFSKYLLWMLELLLQKETFTEADLAILHSAAPEKAA
jgi:hypothetical protein